MRRACLLASATLAAAAAMTTLPALAGGCARDQAECYEKVKAPDVYATVARPVVVEPARTEVVTRPALVMDRLEKVEVKPAHTAVVHAPPVYGTIHRTVEVAPARAHVAWTPAVYATRHREVVVSPGRVRWERKVDASGRETLCKVKSPPVTRTVAEKVLVAPPRKSVHITPAVYRDEQRTVVMREAQTHAVHHPAVYAWQRRPVVVAPATRHVVTHPPVVALRHETRLVQRGGTYWRPVGHRHW